MSYINEFKGLIELLRNQGVDSYACKGRSRMAVDFWFLISACFFCISWVSSSFGWGIGKKNSRTS